MFKNDDILKINEYMQLQDKVLDILKIIADDTRMAILQVLKDGELTVSEIEEKAKKSHSTTSQQLKRMLNANLVTFTQIGTKKLYRIRDHQIFNILEIISSMIFTSEIAPINKDKMKKILIMGLSQSGKTSVLLSFLGNKNLFTFLNKNLKATNGLTHMSGILSELNAKKKIEPKDIYYEYGGQITFRKQFVENPEKILEGFDKIIYVIDIQDTDNYEEATNYLANVITALKSMYQTFDLDIFLHKFDPDLENEEGGKYSQENINDKLITPISKIIPVGFKNTIYRTTIYTIFRKTLMMQSYQM